MKNIAPRLHRSLCIPLHRFFSIAAALTLLPASLAVAQTTSQTQPAPRIRAEVSSAQMTPLPNSKHPLAQAQYDTGRLAANTKLQGMSIHFSRTASQEAQLQALMAAQQNPASPQYHQWLTPDQFAAQFGVSSADIAKVQSWLEQQGFSVDWVARSKNMLRFSGTAGQVEQAFATEMHTYSVPTSSGAVEKHFAPSTVLSVPAAFTGVVDGVGNLDDFRPKPHLINSINRNQPQLKPSLTQDFNGTQYVYFAPGDIATVYDIQATYNAGLTGAGQSIAVVGQSQVSLSDIEAFQSAAGLSVKDPTLIVVPGTGNSQISSGDESESDLDLEWSGAIAKGATINLVYTGSASNGGAFDSIVYAIDERLANIISSSYGTCETDLTSSTQSTMEAAFEQAATQGQTVVSAAGDNGSTDCHGITSLTATQQQALAVDYPGSSPNVLSLGGTEISQANSAYITAPSAYWGAASSSSSVLTTSALQYIPEQAWNEDSICLQSVNQTHSGSPICSGGGGASTLFAKPTWQANVTGIPSDGKRDVPDVSLNAAIANPGYVYCTSDTSGWVTGQQNSCNDGFLDSVSLNPTIAGGTSFAAPIFAGMVAIINQKQNYTTGQGLVNPTLYTLASNSGTYASAFHDITIGNNDCSTASSAYCSGSGTTDYAAGTGYDLATGLGSVDFGNLVAVWPASTVTPVLVATTTTVAASAASPNVGTNDTFTVTVTPETGTTTPTGTVTITVDSNSPVTGNTLTSNGTVTYTTSFSTAGPHTIVAAYSGDAVYGASTGSISVNATAVSSGTGSFKLSATNLTVTQGTSGNSTITITPSGGYTGTVDLTFDTSNDTALQNLCYQFATTLTNGDGTVSVAGKSAVTTQLTLDTNASDCVTAAAVSAPGKHSFRSLHAIGSASNSSHSDGSKTAPITVAFAGLLLAGFLGRYSRKFRSIAGVIALIAIGMGISACGGSSNTISNPPKGTYTVTVTGQDSSSSSITATTTFTFTIQ